MGGMMKEVFESYFAKALYDAKVEEILRVYRNKKFSAKKNVGDGKTTFDVVVKKGKKTIAFEITTAPLTRKDVGRIEEKHETAKTLGYEFRLITIAAPKKAAIGIDWLRDELLRHLRTEGQSLAEPLSAHADYEEIGELAIRSIQIKDSEADVLVNGDVSVSLRYASDAEEKNDHEILPFNGELSLDLRENRIRDAKLKIDTSYWYE